MSWSVNAVGRPSAVAAILATQFSAIKCREPEETIKTAVASAIAVALHAFPESGAVRVEASGSQSDIGTSGPVKNSEAINQLNVKIKPLWGFCE